MTLFNVDEHGNALDSQRSSSKLDKLNASVATKFGQEQVRTAVPPQANTGAFASVHKISCDDSVPLPKDSTREDEAFRSMGVDEKRHADLSGGTAVATESNIAAVTVSRKRLASFPAGGGPAVEASGGDRRFKRSVADGDIRRDPSSEASRRGQHIDSVTPLTTTINRSRRVKARNGQSDMLNANTATYDQLRNLPGVGDKTARAILATRQNFFNVRQRFFERKEEMEMYLLAFGKAQLRSSVWDRLEFR